MSIYGAMGTAVTGLRAQSYALQQISGNIANSQTVGFKRTDSSFADLVPDMPSGQQLSGSVRGFARATNAVQGDVQNSAVPTHMAINGTGFFVVEQRVDYSDNRPVFAGFDLYTRRGDFETDRDGYLVNGAGYYLKGLPVDPITGNIAGSAPDHIRVSNDFLPASRTTEIILRGNLAEYPLTAAADPDTPGSELLAAATLDVNGDVLGANVTSFLQQSIAGGAVTVFDDSGAPINVQFRWGKTSASPDTWNLFYQRDAAAGAAAIAWENVGQTYAFNASGQLNPAVNSVTVTGLSVNGAPIGDVTILHGPNGVTQFGDPNGIAQLTELSQNGYSAGELVGVSISEAGRVSASYTNGRTVDLYQVELAGFAAANRLKALDGGAFMATAESGVAVLGAEGTIIGGALEASNTDIAEEFTKLIVTQQAYAAGTRIVTTSDEMLTEALNMVR